MATIKQCKMLAARSKQAGMDYDFDSFKELENGQVDEKLAEIEAFANKQKPEQKPETAPQTERLNDVRFGMACKLVIQESGYRWALENSKTFIERVEALYKVLNAAENAISASSSIKCYSDHNEDIRVKGSCDYCGETEPDDQDYKAEMAMERAQE